MVQSIAAIKKLKNCTGAALFQRRALGEKKRDAGLDSMPRGWPALRLGRFRAGKQVEHPDKPVRYPTELSVEEREANAVRHRPTSFVMLRRSGSSRRATSCRGFPGASGLVHDGFAWV